MPVENFAAFIGVDWSDKKHDIALQAADCAEVELSPIYHLINNFKII